MPLYRLLRDCVCVCVCCAICLCVCKHFWERVALSGTALSVPELHIPLWLNCSWKKIMKLQKDNSLSGFKYIYTFSFSACFCFTLTVFVFDEGYFSSLQKFLITGQLDSGCYRTIWVFKVLRTYLYTSRYLMQWTYDHGGFVCILLFQTILQIIMFNLILVGTITYLAHATRGVCVQGKN